MNCLTNVNTTNYLPDERNVCAHRSVLASALVAEEDTDVGAAPLRVLTLAVEALLRKDNQAFRGEITILGI